MRPKITGSLEVGDIFLENWVLDNIGFIEEFKIMLLNRANQVIGICQIGTGGTTSVTADPKLILAIALKEKQILKTCFHTVIDIPSI